MHRRLMAIVATASLSAGCPNEAPKQEPAASVATTTQSQAPSASPPASATAGAQKASKPRVLPTKPTPADALGTLPEGVGIEVGQTAPDFELPAHSRGPQSLDALLTRGELLLVFYRGGW